MREEMKDHVPLGLGAYDSDTCEKLLAEHDEHIQAEARKLVPLNLFSEDVLDLEIDELAQNIRIKLWASYLKRSVTHPRAYIRAIAHTTAVDMVRHHRSNVSLSGDAYEESSDLLVARSE